jgi:hypothetical protein
MHAELMHQNSYHIITLKQVMAITDFRIFVEIPHNYSSSSNRTYRPRLHTSLCRVPSVLQESGLGILAYVENWDPI